MNGTKGSCELSPFPDSQLETKNISIMYNASNKEFDYKWSEYKGCKSGSKYYVYGCYC